MVAGDLLRTGPFVNSTERVVSGLMHRFGRLDPGEAIVFVAAAAEHRRGAFDAVDCVMDRLKTEAAFWKREVGPSGARWIEARDCDRDDRRRWDD